MCFKIFLLLFYPHLIVNTQRVRVIIFVRTMVKLLSKIIYNRWYAEVRRISSRRYNLIEEYFFPIDSWPKHIIEIFVTPLRDTNYSDRVKLATFFVGNGLSIANAESLMCFYARQEISRDDRIKMNKILAVMVYADKRENRNRYYYYDMRRHTVFYLDGRHRPQQ